MIVIAIIGILAAIAVPQFDAYRKKGYNASAIWDAKNAAVTQEAYYVDYLTYANNAEVLNDYGLLTTHRVTLTVTGNDEGYTITTHHEDGDKIFTLFGPGGRLEHN
jgi:Tfp pilus assembly protein PilE